MTEQARVSEIVLGKGGGKMGGGGKSPSDDPNTLRSNSIIRMVHLLGWGHSGGLVDGLKSVYVDDVPVQNPDGSYNYEGVELAERHGLPDQDYFPGFSASEKEVAVNVKATKTNPVIRSVTDPDIDSIRVRVGLPALYHYVDAGDNMGQKATTVEYAIDVKSSGGAWAQRVSKKLSGKCVSTYQIEHRIELSGSAPWEVRLRRITDDSTSQKLANETHLSAIVEVIDGKFQYPNCHLVALKVDLAKFGNRIPALTFRTNNRYIDVPDNYDPVTRAYSGFWGGAFKKAVSDNPAWVYYDACKSVGIENVDKFELYQIAQYCDQLIPDGKGGQEPRYTFNASMADHVSAFEALEKIISACNGIAYWQSDSVVPVVSRPKSPVALVSPANVKDGKFSYQGASINNAHTAAYVSWNDPDDFGKLATETYEDHDQIRKRGLKILKFHALGCTSRGQALRMGKWAIETEKSAREVVTYTAGLDHIDYRPGEIVSVADPLISGIEYHGRVVSVSGQTVTLDRDVDTSGATTVEALFQTDKSTIVSAAISSVSANVITLSTAVTGLQPGMLWQVKTDKVEPRLFEVRQVVEESALEYVVTAVEYDPGIYARIEHGIHLPAPSTSLFSDGQIPAPVRVVVKQARIPQSGAADEIELVVSAELALDPRIASVEFQCSVGAWHPASNIETNTATVRGLRVGEKVSFRARCIGNRPSAWTYLNDYTVVDDPTAIPPPTSVVMAGDFHSLIVNWRLPVYPSVKGVEILKSTTNDVATASLVAVATGTSHKIDGLDAEAQADTPVYVWLRTLLHGSDQKSGLTNAVVATPKKLKSVIDITPDMLPKISIDEFNDVLAQQVANTINAMNLLSEGSPFRELHERIEHLADTVSNLGITSYEDRQRAYSTIAASSVNSHAQISNLQQVMTNADQALAQDITALTASVSGNQAAITQTSEALATTQGHMSAAWTLSVSAGQQTGTLTLQAIEHPDGSGTAQLSLKGDMLIDGTVAAAKLNVGELSAISANMGVVTAGVVKSTDGRVVSNYNVGRHDIKDENGVLRVRLGKLS